MYDILVALLFLFPLVALAAVLMGLAWAGRGLRRGRKGGNADG